MTDDELPSNLNFVTHFSENRFEFNNMVNPEIGRFLAVDNFVLNPYSTQDYNRYTYANNNPLMYTDPDGEIPFLAVVAILGIVCESLNLAFNYNNIGSFKDGLYFFGTGFAIGALGTVGGAALAPTIGTGFVAGVLFGGALYFGGRYIYQLSRQ